MQHNEETLIGFEGRELFFQSWRPNGVPRAAIAIVHGGVEHSSRYQSLVDSLVEKGFALAGLDLRGHGRSKGKRGHVMDWNEIREDLTCYLTKVQKEFPGTPLYAYGNSMGGTIILDYGTRHSSALSGAILAGAGIAQAPDATRGRRALLFAARALSALWPTLSLNTRLDLSSLIRDPEVLEEYLHDSLILSTVSARFGAEFMKTIAWVGSHPSDWKLPVLMLYGSEEIFASLDEIREFFGGLGCEDKELIIYEGAYHALHCDPLREQVFSDIESWIDKRLQA
jgi:alpha-beta hydrolase superfamily lysophospholipase